MASATARHRPGFLVPLRRWLRRAWPAPVLSALTGVFPLAPARADIVAIGQVVPALGPGDTTIVAGPGGNLGVGSNGVGRLEVHHGNVLTITGTDGGLFLGGAGLALTTGQGELLVSGPGSAVNVTGSGGFFNVGRWGSTSTGLATIAAGGSVTTMFSSVGIGNNDGVNGATGTVLVDGPGSSLVVSGFNAAGFAAGGTVGRDGGTGTITLSNGATLSMNAAGASAPAGGPGFTLGRLGGTGTFNIESGASAVIDGTGLTGGTGPGFTVGNAGTGYFTANTGGALSIIADTTSGGFTIGTNGGTGTVVFDSSAGVVLTGGQSGIGFTLGREAGSQGSLNVLGGASLTINSGATGGALTVGSAGTGTVTVSGAGTMVLQDGNVTPLRPARTTLAFVPGSQGTVNLTDGARWVIQGSNCCFQVGRLGHGVLNITGGAKLILHDLAGNGGLGIGGGLDDPSGGTFDVLVSGPGSEVQSNSVVGGGIAVGRNPGSSGTFTIDGGGLVTSRNLTVARNTGSSGTLHVTGAGSTVNLLSGVQSPSPTTAANLTVGGSGTGSMTVTAGGTVAIDGQAVARRSAVTVGGAPFPGQGGGNGALTVSGSGSLISVMGLDPGLQVGFDNTAGQTLPATGTLLVEAGGQVLVDANGRSAVGASPGSTGSTTVTGAGSVLQGGQFLGVGFHWAGGPGGTGTLTVADGGAVVADQIRIGPGGTLNGNGGTIVGNVVNDGGIVNPGGSPGLLSIVGSYTHLRGTIVLEVDAFGNHDVLAVEGTATFAADTQIEVRIDPAFQPPSGTVTLRLVQVQQEPQPEPQPLLTLAVSDSGTATVTVDPSLSIPPPAVVPAEVTPAPGIVQIDVKPGSADNTVNLRSAGAIPVAILSSAAFSALSVDPATVTLDGAAVKLVGKGQRPLCNAEDVNGDGYLDLVCHVLTAQLPEQGDGIATLRARTFPTTASPGMQVQGSDFIRIVP
jgi:T5SS/PEP-CTERM-associated repeat protein